MGNDRFETIESKLAHQEHVIAQLNDALSDQQVQLTQIRGICETLIDRVRSMSDGVSQGSPEDERPPHY